ncbi:MAG: NRDE family protein [Alphaproteobacteria bacterium]
MCTLALFSRVLPGLPLVVAANRDEFLARPTASPGLLSDAPQVFGGRDLVAGGTWLCVRETGLVVGVLNRRTGEPPDPSRLSRGSLCADLACSASAADAARSLARVPPDAHNPFNLLVADRSGAWVGQNRGDRTVVEELPPGTHLLTNLDLNDATCPRISHSSRHFVAVGERFAADRDRPTLVAGLRETLADHVTAVDDRQPTDQICIHMDGYGTRSSSVVLVDDRARVAFLHADGPPCRVPHERLALPWDESPETPPLPTP